MIVLLRELNGLIEADANGGRRRHGCRLGECNQAGRDDEERGSDGYFLYYSARGQTN